MKYCRFCMKVYEDKWFHMCPSNVGYSSEFVDDEDEIVYLNEEIDNLTNDLSDLIDERDYWKNKYESMLK